MNTVASITAIVAVASFSWGVLRFFRKPSGLTLVAGAVAALGVVFSLWHVRDVAVASTESWWLAAGMCGHLAATLMFWSSVHACRTRPLTAIFETDAPKAVVRRGIYRHLRHPFYAAYTLFWLSGWVASGSLGTLVSVLVMVPIYVAAARCEERKFARSACAAEYEAYRRDVGVVLPRWRRGAKWTEQSRQEDIAAFRSLHSEAKSPAANGAAM
ncbi:MAG: isoprenylcysteine carboxylmethyltransferase family protein [Acidobacteria bacterium]|nr:isoprenylcysteine carboxylmethyltransferase family protein [Acidobacteriota bacterium]